MTAYAGIDVAKDTLQIALYPQSNSFCTTNTSEGIHQLIQWLSDNRVEQVLVEATGGYERLSVKLLAKARFKVMRINPLRARQFALAMGKQAKTDSIDAQMLAMFAHALRKKEFVVADEARDKLTELVNQRDAFVQQRDDNRRRIQQAQEPEVQQAYRELNAKIQEMIKAADRRIAAQTRQVDGALVDRLQAIKGIGAVSISSLFCYLPELGDLSRGQVAALAGVAPYNNDSGTKRGNRHIYGGRAKLRRAMYMSTLVMVRYNEDFKNRYAQLRARGKCAKVALTACMRVLLVRLNAMVRDGAPWREGTI